MPHNDCLPNPIEPTQTDVKSPLDVQLLDDLRTNQEFLCDQLFSGVAGKVSGAGLGAGAVARILSGGEDNTGIYKKKRFYIHQNTIERADTVTGFDPENKNTDDFIFYYLDKTENPRIQQNFVAYMGMEYIMEDNTDYSFTVKSEANFFVLGLNSTATAQGNNNLVFIDGQTPSSLGLFDENGNPSPDIIPDLGLLIANNQIYYMGLGDGAHTVTIRTDDGPPTISFVDIGFLEPAPAIEKTLTVKDGTCSLRGSEIAFTGNDLTFNETAYGHTGTVVVNGDGTLTALDGVSPARTAIRAEQVLDFTSTTPPTTLPVKNSHDFPTAGICLFQHPRGQNFIFSYSSKNETLIQANSLDGILWQNAPFNAKNWVPEFNFDSTTAEQVGMFGVDHWAEPPIIVTASNKNIDFEIIENGVTSQHTAAITEGAYSADLVPFGTAVVIALTAANKIEGNYFCNFNSENQLWSIGVTSDTVTEINFFWNSGANASSSIASIIGFDGSADSNGSTSYVATEARQHLAVRVFEAEASFLDPTNEKIRYSNPETEINEDRENAFNLFDAEERLGLNVFPLGQTNNDPMYINTDVDCCGLAISFQTELQSYAIAVYVDGAEQQIILQPGLRLFGQNFFSGRNRILTGFVSFPRGSRNVVITSQSEGWEDNAAGDTINFVGARQYFTKPAWEKLTLDQAILKSIDVTPKSFYRTWYGNNAGALYAPQPADDNILTITESGSWFGTAISPDWNAGNRTTAQTGGFVEYTFTLVGNGGGCELRGLRGSLQSPLISFYLSQSAINTGTDLISNATQSLDGSDSLNAELSGLSNFGIRGLPAGTYTARFQQNFSPGQIIDITGFAVIDTVQPQPSAFTLEQVNNTGQGVPHPINTRKASLGGDGNDRTTVMASRNGLKEGLVSLAMPIGDPAMNSFNNGRFIAFGVSNRKQTQIISQMTIFGADHEELTAMAKSISTFEPSMNPNVNGIATTQFSIDSRNIGAAYSTQECVKGGSSPSDQFNSPFIVMANRAFKEFKTPCAFSAGDIFTCTDTRGLKVNVPVLLFDGTNTELAVIININQDANFTVAQARASVVDGLVTEVQFPGLHSCRRTFFTGTDKLDVAYGGFGYEPLPLTFSNANARIEPKFIIETKTNYFRELEVGGTFVQATYPFHGDGSSGSGQTSSLEVLGMNTGDLIYNVSTSLVISGSSISEADPTIDLKITSTKTIQIGLEPLR